MHPLVAAVLLRLAGLDALVAVPSLSHQADNSESPATAREANGAPLSERIASGNPSSSKTRSKARITGAAEVERKATQASRERLYASVTVSG